MRDARRSALLLLLAACGPIVDDAEDGDDGHATLAEHCARTCARIEQCGVPPAIDFPPDWDCNDACLDRWGACPPQAIEFLDCSGALPCEAWDVDPRNTECSAPFEAAQGACGR